MQLKYNRQQSVGSFISKILIKLILINEENYFDSIKLIILINLIHAKN